MLENLSDDITPDPVSLQGVSSASIAGMTRAEIHDVSRQNGLRCTNEQIVALAIFNLSEVIRDALAPINQGEATDISEENKLIIGAALQGVGAKMVERITGFADSPSNFYEILAPDLDRLIGDAITHLNKGTNPRCEEADTVARLHFLGHVIEAALNDAAPLFVRLEEIPFHEGMNFTLDFKDSSYRPAQFGEILPTLELNEGKPSFSKPSPVNEGTLVAQVLGEEFATGQPTADALQMVFERTVITGQIMPNIYEQRLVYLQNDGQYRIIVKQCWIAKVRGMVIFLPEAMGQMVIDHAQLS